MNPQYFGHLIQMANSMEKSLMLAKIEGRRRQGLQRMRWHYRWKGLELGQILGDGEGQGGLVCCRSWGCKESDPSGWLNTLQRKIKMTSVLQKLEWGLKEPQVHGERWWIPLLQTGNQPLFPLFPGTRRTDLSGPFGIGPPSPTRPSNTLAATLCIWDSTSENKATSLNSMHAAQSSAKIFLLLLKTSSIPDGIWNMNSNEQTALQ